VIWWPEKIPTLSVVSDTASDGVAITLRPVIPSDAEAIYLGAQDPEVPKFTTLPADYTLDNAINFAKKRAPERHANRLELIFAIDSTFNTSASSSTKATSDNKAISSTNSTSDTKASEISKTPTLAGIVSLHSIDFANHRAEVGYWLVKEARNKGIGTSAVELITEYGLMTMGFRRIDALVDNRNVASKRLLEKAGYQFEGILKNYVTRPDGNQIDMAIFAATTK